MRKIILFLIFLLNVSNVFTQDTTIIRVKNINDAANKIDSIPGKINRIFFLCHGDAKNGHKAFFSIGSTFLHSKDIIASSALDRIANKLASTTGPLQSKAQVTVFACGAGGTHNGGIELLVAPVNLVRRHKE